MITKGPGGYPSADEPDSARKDADDRGTTTPTPAKVDLAPTRTGRMWVAVTVGALILLALLIFILQNTERTAIAFLGWNFSLPLGIALLFAAIAGLLVMALVGGARIWQLRHAYNKH